MRTPSELAAELRKVRAEARECNKSEEQAALDWLREQIEMRVRGLQWLEFKAQWSSSKDEDAGTVPELTNQLKLIIQAEKQRRDAGELPTHAPAPIPRRKTFKELGEPTAQVALGVG